MPNGPTHLPLAEETTMLLEIPREELAGTLDAVAWEVLEEAGIDRPPVDALLLARRLGVTVAWDDRQSGRARFVRLRAAPGRPSRPTILLRPEPRAERRQWAVAHELGEHVAHRVFALLSVDPREAAPNARERLASCLASRILLPGAWFAADGPKCRWDLFALKSLYATASHELIARRMLDFPPPVIVTIFDQGRVHFRASNIPGRVPPPSPAELECRQRASDWNRPCEFVEAHRLIQGWPVHESGWKREILRTEVDGEIEVEYRPRGRTLA